YKLLLVQVMAALVISISSDVSVESVGSSFLRVILISSNSVEVSVSLEVGAATVASPAGVLEIDTHSSLEADPSKSSPPTVSVAPMVSPFLYIPTASILPAPSTVVSPSSEFPLAPVVPHPGFGIAVWKSIRSLPSHRLALRYTLHHLHRFTSGSSSGHSSSDLLSSRHSISGHSLSEHASPDTIVANSSTPPRFIYPPLARTLRCSEAYLCWRSAPLSTMYPLKTSESSAWDSSSESSSRPSHKRCRSPATNVTSSIYATRALVPSHANLLPPRKRFRDSILLEDSVEEDIDTHV
nr:hypothetical protein [Tanacetum cinerariifolium]